MIRDRHKVFGIDRDTIRFIYAFSVFLHIFAFSMFLALYGFLGYYTFTPDSLISHPENVFVVTAGAVSSITLSISLSIVIYRHASKKGASPRSSLHRAMAASAASLVVLSAPGALLDFSLLALPFIILVFAVLAFLVFTAGLSARTAYRNAAHLSDAD